MRVLPPIAPVLVTDSTFYRVTVPSVKEYTDKVKFTASVSPPTGTITLTFLNRSLNVVQDSLTAYPDSLRLRARTTSTPLGDYTITVTGFGTNGTPVHVRTVILRVQPVGVPSNTQIPEEFYLYQNYPNPFNPKTTIRFDIAKKGDVKINMFDITGKLVTTLADKEYEAGKYSIDFDGHNLSSGIYFYKIETPYFTSIRKMMLIK